MSLVSVESLHIQPVGRRPRPGAATFVLSGAVPTPLLSSSSRAWNGITVELHSFKALDALVQPPDHVVTVILAGSARLQRTRDGRTQLRKVAAGDVVITPVGSPVRWVQVGQTLAIVLRLSAESVRAVAGDEYALDPDRFAIREAFPTRDATIDDIARRLLAALELEAGEALLDADTL